MQKTKKSLNKFDQHYWDGYFERHEAYPVKLAKEALDAIYNHVLHVMLYFCMMFLEEDQISIFYLQYLLHNGVQLY